MTYSLKGHKCKDCDKSFNSLLNVRNLEFWGGKCPECKSQNIINLPQPILSAEKPAGSKIKNF